MHCTYLTRLMTALGLPALLALTACDQTSGIGQSIIDDQIDIEIDSAFTLSGQTVATDSVPARTLIKMLGSVNVDGFGTLSSDFVAEFMPTTGIDTAGVKVDGIRLVMRSYKNDCIGDTLAPAAVKVYRLARPLSYPIYSSDPSTNFFDINSKPLGSAVYTMAAMYNDTIAARNYREISIDLGKPLAEELYDAWKKNPSYFADPATFANKVFHGLAVVNSFGSGRVTRVTQTLMCMDYTVTKKIENTTRDTVIKKTANYFAVTPEVVSNNQLRYTAAEGIRQRVAKGEAITAAPAGYELKLRFPTKELAARYNSTPDAQRMVNSLTVEIPVESIDPSGNIQPPTYVLLVLSNEKKAFFANNKLPDNKTSFYATYSSTTHSYSFNMSDYIVSMLAKEKLEEADYTFSLVPISTTWTEQSNSYGSTVQVISTITPEVTTMSAAKFLLDKAKIKFTYSKQLLAK